MRESFNGSYILDKYTFSSEYSEVESKEIMVNGIVSHLTVYDEEKQIILLSSADLLIFFYWDSGKAITISDGVTQPNEIPIRTIFSNGILVREFKTYFRVFNSSLKVTVSCKFPCEACKGFATNCTSCVKFYAISGNKCVLDSS